VGIGRSCDGGPNCSAAQRRPDVGISAVSRPSFWCQPPSVAVARGCGAEGDETRRQVSVGEEEGGLVTQALISVAGADRTGVRLSPNDDPEGCSDSESASLFTKAVEALSGLKIAFLEMRASRPESTPAPRLDNSFRQFAGIHQGLCAQSSRLSSLGLRHRPHAYRRRLPAFVA
jgi:hypothetical protein